MALTRFHWMLVNAGHSTKFVKGLSASKARSMVERINKPVFTRDARAFTCKDTARAYYAIKSDQAKIRKKQVNLDYDANKPEFKRGDKYGHTFTNRRGDLERGVLGSV